MATRPTNLSEYSDWLKTKHGVAVDARLRSHYETVAITLQSHFTQSDFWNNLPQLMQDCDAEYQIEKSYQLMSTAELPNIVAKPTGSFIEKTFRKNVVLNEKWPRAPRGGWVLPDNWYSQVHDIVRTTLVVKYLDGVQFLAERLRDSAVEYGFNAEIGFEAREQGYYAAHVDIEADLSVPSISFDAMAIRGHLEIQVTTQMKDLIKDLLHRYYDAARAKLPVPAAGELTWQWNYRSDEFITNYLGHVLHYVEGVIIEVRDRQTEAAEKTEDHGGK